MRSDSLIEDSANEKRQTLPRPGADEKVFMPEVPRLLLQLSGDRSDAARHRTPGEALRSELLPGGGTAHEIRSEGEGATAAPPERRALQHGVHQFRPQGPPLHGVRGTARGLPRVSRQPALRLLRVPEVRARPPGRSRLHRGDLKSRDGVSRLFPEWPTGC